MAQVAYPDPRTAFSNLKHKPILNGSLGASKSARHPKFDHLQHLSFVDEPDVLTMKDLDLPDDIGISPVAVSQPFPLFTEEAIGIMRDEIFSQEVRDNCLYSTDFAGCQLRGHCPKYAPFMTDAWKSPKTLSIISKIAEVDLVPIYDFDIGNINISVQNTAEKKSLIAASEDAAVTKWHRDSYPFVCVVMMSDASQMLGGETVLKGGSGKILKVRGPQMGSAVVLQGRCISHQALAAIGGMERIAMITSFRPRDVNVKDTSVLTSVRPLSEPSELYYQWTRYRLEVLQERIRKMCRMLDDKHNRGKRTDIEEIKVFLQLQEAWLAASNKEIVEGEVTADSDLYHD